MIKSFLHLIERALALAFGYMGKASALGAVVLSILLFAVPILREYWSRRKEGLAVIRSIVKRDWKQATTLTVGFWFLVFLWCVAKVVYDDHKGLASADHARELEVQKLSEANGALLTENEELRRDLNSVKSSATRSAAPAHRNIQQRSEGQNSPNIVGNGNQVTVNPHNPNAGEVTYGFNGMRRIISPGRMHQDQGEIAVFSRLKAIRDSRDWNKLVEESNAEIKRAPDWLTPYAFKGIAYLNLGKKDEGIKLLEYVNQMSVGSPDFDEVRKILAAAKQIAQ